MKSHVLRPLFVVIFLLIAGLIVRHFLIPDGFGTHERGYMYGWHNKNDEQFWKNFPVKYKSSDYCNDCHNDKHSSIMRTPHAIIQCENCHGPALGHPDSPPKLPIDRSRAQCLRCHYPLPYPTSGRQKIKSVDPDEHNPGTECSSCHDPHNPDLEGIKS